MPADVLTLALFAVFIAAVLVGGLAGGSMLLGQYTVRGRRYLDLVAEYHAEYERRAGLLAAWAEARGRRIARLEQS